MRWGRVTFSELKLIPELLKAVEKAGYTTPTPIQKDAIPPALAGKDIIGTAQTGTGKTAAFSLPVLQRIDEMAGKEVELRCLVLTPTRELAAQIADSFKTYGSELDIYHTVIFGGVNDKPQIRELRRGVDVLVATPGRLLDLMNQGVVNLGSVDIFVLDEADRMLDMGFLPDVRRVTAKLPQKRQTLFFSATMPAEIRELASGLLYKPVEVSVAPVSATAERVEQHMYFVDKGNKRHLLVDLVEADDVKKCLVFSRTKHGANRIVKGLRAANVSSEAIHGNKSQNARVRALEDFRNGEVKVLVATDIAARGIDIDGVSHVINYDIPNIPETYVHRIGRTARAGAEGIALSFCESEERPFLVDIARLIRRNIPRVEDHSYPPSEPVPEETDLERKGRGGGARRAGAGNSGSRGRGHGAAVAVGPVVVVVVDAAGNAPDARVDSVATVAAPPEAVAVAQPRRAVSLPAR